MRCASGADRRVGHRPVDRQPEPAPQLLERALVALGQRQAQLDEVGARDRDRLRVGRLGGRLEVGVVGHRRVAAHAVVVLHAPLGGQAVVVPAHRIEDLPAAHPLVARDRVGVRVGEHVADVQRAADRRRRRVDREDALARSRAVEAVGPLALPDLAPPRLEPVERRLLGHRRARQLAAGGGLRRGVGLWLRGRQAVDRSRRPRPHAPSSCSRSRSLRPALRTFADDLVLVVALDRLDLPVGEHALCTIPTCSPPNTIRSPGLRHDAGAVGDGAPGALRPRPDRRHGAEAFAAGTRSARPPGARPTRRSTRTTARPARRRRQRCGIRRSPAIRWIPGGCSVWPSWLSAIATMRPPEPVPRIAGAGHARDSLRGVWRGRDPARREPRVPRSPRASMRLSSDRRRAPAPARSRTRPGPPRAGGASVPPVPAPPPPRRRAGSVIAWRIAAMRSSVASIDIAQVIGRLARGLRQVHAPEKARRAAVAARLFHRSLDEAAVYGFRRPVA